MNATPLPNHGRSHPLDLVLRDRTALLHQLERGEDLPHLTRVFLLTVISCAALVGAVLGGMRGETQIAFGALKLPLVVVLTAAIIAPSLTCFIRATTGGGDLRRDLTAVLASLALGLLLTAATTPLLLLAYTLGVSYHKVVLLTVACCCVGGAAGFGLLLRAVGRWSRGLARVPVLVGVLTLMTLVGGQMAWTFRPYLVRPQTVDVPFMRAAEGSFFEAVAVTIDSAVRPDAAVPAGRWGAAPYESASASDAGRSSGSAGEQARGPK